MSLQAPPPAPALQGLPTILPFSQTLPRSPLPPASVPLPPGLTQPGPVLLDGHPLRGLLFFIHHHQRGGRTRRLGDHCEGGHTTERERGGAGEAGLGQPGRGGPDPSKGWTWGHPSKRGPWCLWGGGGDRPGPPRPPSPLGAQDLPPQLDLELELRLAQAGGGLGGRGGGAAPPPRGGASSCASSCASCASSCGNRVRRPPRPLPLRGTTTTTTHSR